MDALVELLPLLFIAAYYLLASRRKAQLRKRAQQAGSPTSTTAVHDSEARAQPTEATPFQSFLEQLEQSIAEANGLESEKPTSTPELGPEPAPLVAPPPPLRDREFSVLEGSFDGVAAVDHEAHGFGAQNPLSEEAFERAAPFAPRPPAPSRTYDPHGLAPRRPPSTRPSWHERVRAPMAARDAFVLQTVFGARGGRKGH